MKSKVSTSLLLASLLAESGLNFKPYKPREPQNKYNLTDEQIEQMATMTPKEKKKFIKTLQSKT